MTEPLCEFLFIGHDGICMRRIESPSGFSGVFKKRMGLWANWGGTYLRYAPSDWTLFFFVPPMTEVAPYPPFKA